MKCGHTNKEVRKKLATDNRWMVGWFCMDCKRFRGGQWISQKNLDLDCIPLDTDVYIGHLQRYVSPISVSTPFS